MDKGELIEDLMVSYESSTKSLTDEEMLNEIDPDNKPIEESEWAKFSPPVKYLKGLTKTELGDLLVEYIEESEHSSWEGYEPDEVRVIYALFTDMATYHAHRD